MMVNRERLARLARRAALTLAARRFLMALRRPVGPSRHGLRCSALRAGRHRRRCALAAATPPSAASSTPSPSTALTPFGALSRRAASLGARLRRLAARVRLARRGGGDRLGGRRGVIAERVTPVLIPSRTLSIPVTHTAFATAFATAASVTAFGTA